MLGEYSPGRGSPVVWTMAHRLLRTAFVSRPDHGACKQSLPTHGSSSQVTALRPSRPRTRALRVSLPTAFVPRPDHGACTHRICIAPGSRRLKTFAPDTAHRLRSQPSGPLDPALEHFVSLYRALALPGHLLSSSSWSPRRPRSNSASRRGALAHKNVPSEHALASLSPPPSGSKNRRATMLASSDT